MVGHGSNLKGLANTLVPVSNLLSRFSILVVPSAFDSTCESGSAPLRIIDLGFGQRNLQLLAFYNCLARFCVPRACDSISLSSLFVEFRLWHAWMEYDKV